MAFLVPQCSESDYEKLLAIVESRGEFPDSYAIFLSNIQNRMNDLASRGHAVYPVDVNVDEFVAWCRANNKPINHVEFRFFAFRKFQESLPNIPRRITASTFLNSTQPIEPLWYSDTIDTDSKDN